MEGGNNTSEDPVVLGADERGVRSSLGSVVNFRPKVLFETSPEVEVA